MATVPLQQTPSVEIETGGTPLFSATNIQPVQDTGVAQDIGRLSNAQKQFAQIAIQLQGEQDDVKANEATREYNDYANQQMIGERGQTIKDPFFLKIDFSNKCNRLYKNS